MERMWYWLYAYRNIFNKPHLPGEGQKEHLHEYTLQYIDYKLFTIHRKENKKNLLDSKTWKTGFLIYAETPLGYFF